jgi:hypothetical protein
MPKATLLDGSLKTISDCYIVIPLGNNNITITLDNLPDISDTKSASYSDETVIGRASPLKTYSQSDNRSISMQLHFIISKPSHVYENLQKLRAIQSAVYPRDGANGAPFVPPPVCKIKCGKLLSDSGELCVILKTYSVKFPTEVAWMADLDDMNGTVTVPPSASYTPIKFDVDTTWDVVYASSDLPGQERIFNLGA